MSELASIIPKTFRIGPHTYKIMRSGRMDAEQLWGEIHSTKRIIEIGFTTGLEQLVVTFLHELMHGIWDVYGSGKMPKEEQVISALSTGLAQVLLDIGLLPRGLVIEDDAPPIQGQGS